MIRVTEGNLDRDDSTLAVFCAAVIVPVLRGR
jgi:hypothetical protein